MKKLLMVLALLPLMAVAGGDYTWETQSNGSGTVSLVGIIGWPTGVVQIPASVNGKAVTALGYGLFDDYDDITEIVVWSRVEGDVFLADLEDRSGNRLALSVDAAAAWDAWQLSGGFAVNASSFLTVEALEQGALVADFLSFVTVDGVKKALSVRTNLWLDRSDAHDGGAGGARVEE